MRLWPVICSSKKRREILCVQYIRNILAVCSIWYAVFHIEDTQNQTKLFVNWGRSPSSLSLPLHASLTAPLTIYNILTYMSRVSIFPVCRFPFSLLTGPSLARKNRKYFCSVSISLGSIENCFEFLLLKCVKPLRQAHALDKLGKRQQQEQQQKKTKTLTV